MKVAQPGSVLTSTNHFYNLVLNLEKKKKKKNLAFKVNLYATIYSI